MNRLILLSGIPASGKSTYGKWLATNKGYIYWDLENETLEQAGNRANLYLGTDHNLDSLVEAITTLTRVVIIDWGFPPDTSLNTVKLLKDKGAELWWFDGDRKAAEISFLKRGNVPGEALKVQIEKIRIFWPEILRVFKGHIIKTVTRGPEYMSPQAIYEIMFT
jgi:hypothetical protein